MSSKKEEIKNIIFILIDNFRAINLGCYGYKKNTSPTIDQLANEGVLFENAFTNIPSTDPAMTTIFSGLYPLVHGITIHKNTPMEMIQNLNDKKIKLLPEILQEHGFNTIAVDWLGRWHRRGYNIYTGFQKQSENKFSYSFKHKIFKRIYEIILNRHIPIPLHLIRVIGKSSNLMYRLKGQETAEFITDQAINLFKKNINKKNFIFLHYWDTHDPYYYDKIDNNLCDLSCINKGKLIKKLKETDLYHRKYSGLWTSKYDTMEDVVVAYNSAIHYVDKNIHRLISFLKKNDLYDNSLIVLTGDHGTLLTEHTPYFTHATLYQPVVKVPLIIKEPSLQQKKVKSLVQHIDILPTLLNLLNIPYKYNFDGFDVLSLKDNRSCVFIQYDDDNSYSIILENKYKYIHHENDGYSELYDLLKDPNEKNNIINNHPKLYKILHELLKNQQNELTKKGEILKVKKISKKLCI